MNTAPYRRIYFACCKQLGLDDATRHDFNKAQTGKESTRDFSVEDWRHVTAELQRLCGQDTQPSRPRVKVRESDHNDMISAGQLELLGRLASSLKWRKSCADFIRGRLLSRLRRETWDGQYSSLFAVEARSAIAALRRMIQQAGVRKKESEPCRV